MRGAEGARFGDEALTLNEAGDSAQGVCDLLGNVAEMVADGFHAGYAGAPVDGSAWLSSAALAPVVRGGGWSEATPDARGFRLVRTAD